MRNVECSFVGRGLVVGILAVAVLASCSSSSESGGGAGGGVYAGGSGGSVQGGSGGVSVGGGAGGVTGGAGGTTVVTGGGGGSTGGSGGATGGTGGTTVVTGGGGGSTGGSGGSTGGTGGTDAGATGGSSGNDGAAGSGGAESGTGTCAGHAISMSANGTGSASDAAYSHVEITMGTDLPIGNAKRTVEFWTFIRSTDWVGEKNEIYFYGGGAGQAAQFGLDFGTNAVVGSPTNHATLNPFTVGGFDDDSGKDLGINSSSDQWLHVAMVWDQTALVTYVNGLPKITTTGSGGVTALATGTSVLMIGCNPNNRGCFGGMFDELRVWNVARSAAEIQASFNKPVVGNEAGLVGYWKFDETGGTSAADSVTTAGHTAHPGTLKADTAAHLPTFVVPSVPIPMVCP
jgi:hypothetical protein